MGKKKPCKPKPKTIEGMDFNEWLDLAEIRLFHEMLMDALDSLPTPNPAQVLTSVIIK